MNETQIVLAGVLLVLISSVAFNAGSITSFAVRNDAASMTLSPRNIQLDEDGSRVLISIMPGKEGVSKTIFVQDVFGKTIGKAYACNEEYRCYQNNNVEYIFGYGSLEGTYYFSIHDYSTGNDIKESVSISR